MSGDMSGTKNHSVIARYGLGNELSPVQSRCVPRTLQRRAGLAKYYTASCSSIRIRV